MDLNTVTEFYSEASSILFEHYNLYGRAILDFMHNIFDKLFYFFLFLAVIISLFYLIMSMYMTLTKKKRNEHEFIPEKAPLITVQIPTYNELAAIRCATRCLQSDYPREKFEILIGDDSDNPKVSKKLDIFAEKHSQVRISRRGNNKGYKAGNLNHMLKISNGDIIVIFDSDFAPERDFLRRIVTPFIHDSSISAVQARWKFMNQNQNLVSILGSTIVTVFHHICLPFINYESGISFLCGSAEAVRKKDLLELGQWETGSLTEDIEFSLRLLENHRKIIYLEKLECAGEVPHKAKDLYNQQMRWAYGVVHSFRNHLKNLFINRKLKAEEKLYITFFCSGYLLSFLLILLFTTGTLSFLTHTPGPIDIARFTVELTRNVLLTSGLIVASAVAMIKSKNFKRIIKMVLASFSIGLVVTYYVNVGIFKVLFNRPMEWYMLSKEGNSLY